MSSVPLIYAEHRPQPLLGAGARLIAGSVAAVCLAVLLIAARLTPDASGVETHLQLGLAPCGMLRSTGLPCIACGMTTSFAHLAHGHIVASLITQPAGTVFALLTACGFWTGGYSAATGRPTARMINRLPLHLMFLALLAIALLGWSYKIAAVMRGWHA